MGEHMEKETMDLIAKIRDEEAANERAQIEQVFGLTGGELEETAWGADYLNDGASMPIVFTYWYQGVPEYVQSEYDAMVSDYAPIYRTVCRDEMFGQVPETVTDDEGTWKVVARYRTSGECECPYRNDDNPPIPTKANPCPLCDSWGMDMDVRGREDEEYGFHGYIYIGDGWAEIVYRLMPPAFTPDPNCDNCDGTGIFEVVNGEDVPCTFCLRDAIKRGEIEGTIGDALQHVEFDWSTEHGQCYNCGLPAAFQLVGDATDTGKRCSVCAANDAADGEQITRLFPEN